MTVEKSNAKFSVHSAGKLPDYDKEIRKTRVTRTRYFDHAVRYINSKDNTEDAKKLVITRLASYPSEAIDGIFHQIDNMLMKAELSISKKQRLLIDAAQIDEDNEKEIVHVVEKVHQDKVEDLYDSIFNEGEAAAKEEENTVEPTTADADSVENVENPETDSGI
jgi:plasmid stabilization system protein ParE